MSSVFWDSSSILFIDCLENEETVNNDYYCALLVRLNNYKKTALFVEEKIHLFARQCTNSQIDQNDGKNQ